MTRCGFVVCLVSATMCWGDLCLDLSVRVAPADSRPVITTQVYTNSRTPGSVGLGGYLQTAVLQATGAGKEIELLIYGFSDVSLLLKWVLFGLI